MAMAGRRHEKRGLRSIRYPLHSQWNDILSISFTMSKNTVLNAYHTTDQCHVGRCLSHRLRHRQRLEELRTDHQEHVQAVGQKLSDKTARSVTPRTDIPVVLVRGLNIRVTVRGIYVRGVNVHVRLSVVGERCGPASIGMAWLSSKTNPLLICVTTSDLVVLHQKVY